MAIPPATRQHLADHLGQAEFALKIAANFDCLSGTPAHESVRAALARVAEARAWVRAQRGAETPVLKAEFALSSVTERRRVVHGRMGRMTP